MKTQTFFKLSPLACRYFSNSNQDTFQKRLSSAFERCLGWHLGPSDYVVIVNGVLGPRMAQISDWIFPNFIPNLKNLTKRQPGYQSRALFKSFRKIPWLASGVFWFISSRQWHLHPILDAFLLEFQTWSILCLFLVFSLVPYIVTTQENYKIFIACSLLPSSTRISLKYLQLTAYYSPPNCPANLLDK